MEYWHLMKHKDSKVRAICNISSANEIGRLFQSVGKGDQNRQRIKGAEKFFFINYDKYPKHKIKEVPYARFVCTIREMKKDKHRTRIKLGGNNIKYAGDVGNPTVLLETPKLLFNSVLSRKGSKFMTIDIEFFYLMTPMEDYKYLHMNISDIPDETIDE